MSLEHWSLPKPAMTRRITDPVPESQPEIARSKENSMADQQPNPNKPQLPKPPSFSIDGWMKAWLKTLTKTQQAHAKWITNELTAIAILVGEEITLERIGLTVRELISIDQPGLDKAFARVRKELKFFPKPVEIIERLPLEAWKS